MDKKKYEFEDFLGEVGLLDWVKDEDKKFIIKVHEVLLKRDCKVKITSSKTNPFLLAYTQKRKGVLSLYLRKKGLKMRINVNNLAEYPDVVNALPERLVSQIDKSNVCKNTIEGEKCWEGCIGYDFYIGEVHYQRCRFHCFQFDVEEESLSVLLQLLDSELNARGIA